MTGEVWDGDRSPNGSWDMLCRKRRKRMARAHKSSDDVVETLGRMYDAHPSVLTRNSRRLPTLERARDEAEEGSIERADLDAAIVVCRNDIFKDIKHGYVTDEERAACVEAYEKEEAAFLERCTHVCASCRIRDPLDTNFCEIALADVAEGLEASRPASRPLPRRASEMILST